MYLSDNERIIVRRLPDGGQTFRATLVDDDGIIDVASEESSWPDGAAMLVRDKQKTIIRWTFPGSVLCEVIDEIPAVEIPAGDALRIEWPHGVPPSWDKYRELLRERGT